MISVRPYEASDRAAWDAFVNQSKTPMFMFDRGFMEYHADRFEDASLLFVLASEHYGESDYVRDYAEFRRLARTE